MICQDPVAYLLVFYTNEYPLPLLPYTFSPRKRVFLCPTKHTEAKKYFAKIHLCRWREKLLFQAMYVYKKAPLRQTVCRPTTAYKQRTKENCWHGEVIGCGFIWLKYYSETLLTAFRLFSLRLCYSKSNLTSCEKKVRPFVPLISTCLRGK